MPKFFSDNYGSGAKELGTGQEQYSLICGRRTVRAPLPHQRPAAGNWPFRPESGPHGGRSPWCPKTSTQAPNQVATTSVALAEVTGRRRPMGSRPDPLAHVRTAVPPSPTPPAAGKPASSRQANSPAPAPVADKRGAAMEARSSTTASSMALGAAAETPVTQDVMRPGEFEKYL